MSTETFKDIIGFANSAVSQVYFLTVAAVFVQILLFKTWNDLFAWSNFKMSFTA